jgi:endonuclease/exonuclease/phosphatase family metal-dependent hydrolase
MRRLVPSALLLALLAHGATETAVPLVPAAVTQAKPIVLRVATYNVRNYVATDRQVDGKYNPDWPKPEAEKTALRAVIREAHPDILALEEMGGAPYLEELRRDLATEGLDYPFSALVLGPDPDRHIALLSRVPFAQTHPRETIAFKLGGATELVKRGLLEVDFMTNGQPWSLYVLHLKSRLTEISSDPESAAEREGEARTLRDLIRKEHTILAGNTTTAHEFVAIAGDFNDAKDAPPLQRFLELNNKPFFFAAPAVDSRGETWTLYYPKADQYEHSDFILLSPAFVPLQKGKGGIIDGSDSLRASDHRLVWVDLMFPPVARGKN